MVVSTQAEHTRASEAPAYSRLCIVVMKLVQAWPIGWEDLSRPTMQDAVNTAGSGLSDKRVTLSLLLAIIGQYNNPACLSDGL